MSKQTQALKLARDWINANGRYDRVAAILTVIDLALADSALERMAENERELGLDYMEPAIKQDLIPEQPAQTATYTCGVCGVSMQMEQPAPATELREQQEPVSWERFMSVEKELQDMTAEFMRVAKELDALKTQQQEPVAWRWENGGEDRWLNKYIYLDNGGPDCPEDCEPLYTSPPASKPWVGLKADELRVILDGDHTRISLALAIEAKLREKNA